MEIIIKVSERDAREIGRIGNKQHRRVTDDELNAWEVMRNFYGSAVLFKVASNK